MIDNLKVRQLYFKKKLKAKEEQTGEHVKQLTPYKNHNVHIKFSITLHNFTYIFSRTPYSIRRYHYIYPKTTQIKRFYYRLHIIQRRTHEHVYQIDPYISQYKSVKFSINLFGFTYIFSVTPKYLTFCNRHSRQAHYSHYLFKKTPYIRRFYRRFETRKHNTGEHIKQCSKYISYQKNIHFKCLDCGLNFNISPRKVFTPFDIKHNNPICPNLASKNTKRQLLYDYKRKKKWTTKTVARAIKEITNGEYILKSQFYKLNKPILIEHHSKQCYFYQKHHKYGCFHMTFENFYYHKEYCTWDNHINRVKGSHPKTTDQFNKEVQQKTHGHFKVVSEYINTQRQVCIMHLPQYCYKYKRCGKSYTWWDSPNTFLKYLSCPYDAKYRVFFQSKHTFYKYLHRQSKNEFITLSKFKGVKKYILIGHLREYCNYFRHSNSTAKYYAFETTPERFERGILCPADNASRGEHAMINWLTRHNLRISHSKHYLTNDSNFIYGYITKHAPYTINYQHFDIYIPNLKYNNYYTNGVEIEFNGQQHFETVPFFNSLQFRNLNGKYNYIIKLLSELTFINQKKHDYVKSLYCRKYRVKKININDKTNLTIHNIQKLVNDNLNSKLLSILKKNNK